MIAPTLKKIKIEGIVYDVEYSDAKDAFILMSPFQDVEISVSQLISNAYRKYHYVNEAGDDDCEDSEITREINENAEQFIRENFRSAEVIGWP